MTWQPHIAVAAITERDGRFLVVEEKVGGRLVLNQPAGHWENNESLIQAVIRETQEETAWTFEPTSIVGLYHWKIPSRDITYLRICFSGKLLTQDRTQELDKDIEQALWLTRGELVAREQDLRSPMVLRCIDDYLNGQQYPLSLLVDI